MNAAVWFHDHGVPVFPTVNKKPAVPKGTSQFDYRCSREQATRFKEYGVPLSAALGVLDADCLDDELWARGQIAEHAIPEPPFTVTTGPYHDGSFGLGLHRYFRLIGAVPKFLRRDGHTIEFKNVGQYVVGPGSVRPDGVVYRASNWSWQWEDIPFFPTNFVFDDGLCGQRSAPGEPYEFPEVVRESERHDQLFRLLRSFKGSGIDRDTTREIVHLANENRCQPPLPEDHAFEQWFARAWNLRDRPFTPTRAPEIPDRPLEPQTPTDDYDLDAPGGPI